MSNYSFGQRALWKLLTNYEFSTEAILRLQSAAENHQICRRAFVIWGEGDQIQERCIMGWLDDRILTHSWIESRGLLRCFYGKYTDDARYEASVGRTITALDSGANSLSMNEIIQVCQDVLDEFHHEAEKTLEADFEYANELELTCV